MSYAYTTHVFKVFHHVQTSPFFVGYKLGDREIAQLHCQRCSAIDAAAENAIGGKGGSKSHGTVQMCPTCFWNLLDMLLEFCEHHVVVPCLKITRYSKTEYHHLAHAWSPVNRLFQSDHKWPKKAPWTTASHRSVRTP